MMLRRCIFNGFRMLLVGVALLDFAGFALVALLCVLLFFLCWCLFLVLLMVVFVFVFLC